MQMLHKQLLGKPHCHENLQCRCYMNNYWENQRQSEERHAEDSKESGYGGMGNAYGRIE
jgi:hypothetical protein